MSFVRKTTFVSRRNVPILYHQGAQRAREGSHYRNSPPNPKKRFPNKPNPKTLKQTMLGNFANVVVVDLAIGG
jgi:hypothetical protein